MSKLLLILFVFLTTTLFSQKESKLIYNLKKEDTYIVTADINSLSIQEIEGNTQKISTTQSITYKLKITETYPEGCNFLVKFEKISTTVNRAGEKRFYNSDSTNNGVSKMFKTFLDKKLNFYISKRGVVTPVYNIDSLFRNESDAEHKFVFSQSVEQKITEILPFPVIFSEKTISGNKWTVSDTTQSGIFRFYDKTFNIDSTKSNNIFITEKSNISTDKNLPVPMNNVYIYFDLTGNFTGNYIINPETFIINKGTTVQKASGEVNMKYTESSYTADSWIIKIENTVNIKCLKI